MGSLTANVQLTTPTVLGDSGTWGTELNSTISAEDAMYGSATSVSLSNSNVPLTTTQQQVSILRFSGALGANVQVTVSLVKSWIVENTCTGAFVVTVTGGAGNVVALPPGSCQIYWDGGNCNFVNLGQISGYLDLATTTVPTWITNCTVPPYLLCNGGTFSAVTYPLLNAILGGNTLPDFQGRLPAYMDGGTNRITSGGSGVSGVTLFASGGSQNRSLAQANLPNVSPPVTDPGHLHSYFGGPPIAIGQVGSGSNNASSGSAQSTGTASTGITVGSINGNVTQQSFTTLPPIAMSGIRMIRAA